MKKAIVLELDEAVIAKINLMMAFYNCNSIEEYFTQTAEIDWVAMNELKLADVLMDSYIGHDFGYAEEK